MIGDIIIANVVASAFLVLFIYLTDLNEKEPSWTLVRLYLLSIVITFLFGKAKAWLFVHYQWEFSPLVSHYIVAGFFEELLKLFIVLVFVWPLKSFNEETDGIVYYLIVAAGFSVLENVGYSVRFVINPFIYGLKTGEMSFYRDALEQIVLLRVVSGHVFINIVSGVFLGLAKRRHKWWLLIPGFVFSVLLHGGWNHAAMLGVLPWYALLFLILDGVLFVRVVHMSFYYKFVTRLKERMRILIAQARALPVSEDLVILMNGIRRNVSSLRRLEGDELVRRAQIITETLPPRIDSVPQEGKGGLVERMLKVNGLLEGKSPGENNRFLIGLFLKFALTGFVVLLLLMELS